MRSGAVFLSVLCSSLAVAGESGIKSMSAGIRPVVSLLGGYASIEAGSSSRHVSDDNIVFSYTGIGNGKSTGFIGSFAGIEFQLPYYNLFMQGGVEYDYFGSVRVNGINTVGIEPSTLTLYNYRYNFQSQQVLAVAKLFTTTHQIIHPYAAVGIGAAFNNAQQYRAVTPESGSINLTPFFHNSNHTSFTYNLGLGIDADINKKIRVGLGYRFSDFGKSSLGNGQVLFNDYVAPVAFRLNSSHAYANQLIAQISYVA